MTDQLSRSAEESDGVDPTWVRLEDQLGWYDHKSVATQQAYKRIKLAQLVVGATSGRCWSASPGRCHRLPQPSSPSSSPPKAPRSGAVAARELP
jgi:hypothetical protein